MTEQRADIRGVLIQVQGGSLLLPNAAISEVLAYAPPEPVGDAPDWLLGVIRWRGWQVPMISFAQLSGLADETARLGNKVVILKNLADQTRFPYYALLTQGFPRLVTVARDALHLHDEASDVPLPDGVQARVLLREDPALIPDLEHVQARLAEAVAHTDLAQTA